MKEGVVTTLALGGFVSWGGSGGKGELKKGDKDAWLGHLKWIETIRPNGVISKDLTVSNTNIYSDKMGVLIVIEIILWQQLESNSEWSS
jgi:hypothetical protein